MSKIHTIKTIEDITNVVNKDNIDNFLIDFRLFLEMAIESKPELHVDTIMDFFKGKAKIARMDKTQFNWLEDGKHNGYKTYKDATGKIVKKVKIT